MNTSFRLLPEVASRGGSEIDLLAWALLAVSTLFSVVIAVALIVFVVRYYHTREVNRQSGWLERHHLATEIVWTIVPLLILLIFFGWGAEVYVRGHQPPPETTNIYVVAKQWMWKIGHEQGSREINQLHVPVGQPVRLTMISEDVIHSFYVPAFRNKQDVLPARYTTLWFQPTKTGVFHLFCAEYCGTSHSAMRGTVIVQTPEEYEQWLRSGEELSPEQRGRRHLASFGCLQCHDPLEGNRSGPPLAGLYGSLLPLASGHTVRVDASYIRRAIVEPQAEIHRGYQKMMPSYQTHLTPEQILEITAYLKSIADASGPVPGPAAF
ncbi:cytochrome c oxidase subunit II [Gimesia sp.]|uniref:cytochrome c oxidase subunit II n=1 Tax=Gimesia sp. TaxID=2024833 RepID=UPI000C47F26C|nr:cytochrome c oxidase subunit II [Gimesia sp.]MAX34969.1 cytochrome c oxidase subunit II [Gimesia sp.]HAH47837.1 cytochrome c oxidase subunit II [Planctomycetaceae bacterium]HBL45311.1 cytochrome c oxidase subunit II [Planctomycetaceae bacterium]